MIATEWGVSSVLWTMFALFFWTMAIWIFITLFADIFRREDIGGWAKAGWVLFLFVVPFLGALIYMIARPKMTTQDRRMMEETAEAQRRLTGYSPADEIAKLATLHDEGKITSEEYDQMKQRALISV